MPRYIGEVVNGNEYRGFPVSGRITSRFGARDIPAHMQGHTGVDIAAPAGTILRTPAAGVVWYVATNNPTFGNWCIIKWDDGLGYGLFGHMLDSPHVDVDEHVEIGDKIGRVGSTGQSTGPHVHWGAAWRDNPWHRRQGKLHDPLTLLHTPDERMGELSPAMTRVPLIMAEMKRGLLITPQPRNFNGRRRLLVQLGRE